VITLDNGFDHTKPNTFGPARLASLDRRHRRGEGRDDSVRAVAVTGKPFIFAVGADLTGSGGLANRDRRWPSAALGHGSSARLRDATIPTFALVNGATMGGGLELALHCHYRTVSSGAAPIAFPRSSSAWCPGGAAPSCCRTSSAPTRRSP
jgi:enoyl-CoA hydratase/carnithine racemase